MKNKKIIITGSSKGIGKFLCNEYLRRGHLVFGCSRSESDIIHDNYHHYITDVTVESDIKKMLLKIKSITKKY